MPTLIKRRVQALQKRYPGADVSYREVEEEHTASQEATVVTTVRVTKNASAEMARLCPPGDEIWEILSKTPKPSLRLFGSFAAKDIFFALTHAERVPLAQKGSQAWRDVLTAFKAERKKILYELKPYEADVVPDHYISKGVPR